ncbi:hypothetical protein K0M31_012813 [Melipona bicolor]|uniref:Uncharacterized protein n=1 Tax=Melipona bicolor TaxID=60889 RepID=A0AA40KH44_9HYME|nr:hypothetical protein K0M31_012813 [Melipona bicolor]
MVLKAGKLYNSTELCGTDNDTFAGKYDQSNAGEIPQQNDREERTRSRTVPPKVDNRKSNLGNDQNPEEIEGYPVDNLSSTSRSFGA